MTSSDYEGGGASDDSGNASAVADMQRAVEQAQENLEQAQTALEQAKADRVAMERRLELAHKATAMADRTREQTRRACDRRLKSVNQSVEVGVARLTAARQALEAYVSTHPPTAKFQAWLKWSPAAHRGPVTPDMLRDRMNLPPEQQKMLQTYLYQRNPAYRAKVDNHRRQWAAAQGDAERNMVARQARISLSGEFGEQMARYALAPLGGRIETQGRTFVGNEGRYTKTDLLVSDLRAPVILGRGEGMGAPAGGSIAFEVKCGSHNYLSRQRDHMIFQAQGHRQADARCTLCSHDLRDMSPEQEKSLRDDLRDAGSPLVGMLPRKSEIDNSCLEFIRQGAGGRHDHTLRDS